MENVNFNYDNFVIRNKDYIDINIQNKIKDTTLLIAGCGIGSSFAIAAARMGFTKFILSDGDTVGLTNLNRQFYTYDDIGKNKTDSLEKHILEINPEAKIEKVGFLEKSNVGGILSNADFIFDTIDFLDLGGIVSLHDEAHKQNKPCITALSIGFDAGVLYFPKDSKINFRDVFNLPKGDLSHLSYTEVFEKVIRKLAPHLRSEVVTAVSKALTIMEDGKPCPASQVVAGSFSVGVLATTLLYRIFAGLDVNVAPNFLISNVHDTLTSKGINLIE